MSWNTLLFYTIASLALAVTPGPTMLLALSNGISGGMRRAGWCALGTSIGSALVIGVVALGLGAIMQHSHWLFQAMRVAGVFYLAWMGWRMCRAPAMDLQLNLTLLNARRSDSVKVTSRALLVAVSNPKSVLFFAAFLPQFIDAQRPAAMQYTLLGGISIVVDLLIIVVYGAAGTQAMRWLSRKSLRMMNRGCALGMWVLAASLAFWRRPAA